MMKMDGKKHINHEKNMNNDYESSFEDSIGSSLSSCSSEDVTSSFSSSSSSNGPLYELSELMSQLPMKRGLSKYYQGKSQTFTSLASVKSLEDLVKKPSNTRTIKSCKSNEGGLNHHIYSPKAVISKKKYTTTSISLLLNPKTARNGTVFTSFGIL